MIQDLFNTTMTVWESSSSDDGYGGLTPTWSSNGSYSCRLRTVAASRNIIDDAGVVLYTHKIWCAPIDGLTEENKVEIDGKSFRIVSIIKAQNANEVEHYQLLCREWSKK